MKRLFDFIVSLGGVIVLSPILLILSLLVFFNMGRPVFYLQKRIGLNGKPFKIIKFRSMVKDAETKGPSFTAGGDPRITPIGRFLRKYKLDELPQLLNVIKGDMSFVGPRPEVAEYVEMYTEEQKKVLTVRPGLTDTASIVYRDEETVLARYEDSSKAYIEKIMPAKLRLNLAYLEKAGFAADLGLIFKTLEKIFWNR